MAVSWNTFGTSNWLVWGGRLRQTDRQADTAIFLLNWPRRCLNYLRVIKMMLQLYLWFLKIISYTITCHMCHFTCYLVNKTQYMSHVSHGIIHIECHWIFLGSVKVFSQSAIILIVYWCLLAMIGAVSVDIFASVIVWLTTVSMLLQGNISQGFPF